MNLIAALWVLYTLGCVAWFRVWLRARDHTIADGRPTDFESRMIVATAIWPLLVTVAGIAAGTVRARRAWATRRAVSMRRHQAALPARADAPARPAPAHR